MRLCLCVSIYWFSIDLYTGKGIVCIWTAWFRDKHTNHEATIDTYLSYNFVTCIYIVAAQTVFLTSPLQLVWILTHSLVFCSCKLSEYTITPPRNVFHPLSSFASCSTSFQLVPQVYYDHLYLLIILWKGNLTLC